MAYAELLRDSRMWRLLRAAPRLPETRCELCALPIGDDHRHLLEPDKQRIRCACRACCVLFDRRGARYRLIPDRVQRLDGFALDDARWADLAIPVGLAYFVRTAGGVRGYYPSPLGAAESALGLEAWAAIEADNPVLRTLEADVEALLVRRMDGRREQWIVPIDGCYRLVAIVRSHWRGLSGGDEVWLRVDQYFDTLREEHSTCPTKS